MLCSNCNTANDDQYVFCVNCGGKIAAAPTVLITPRDEPVPATVRAVPRQIIQNTPEISEPTMFVPAAFRQPIAEASGPPQGNSILKILGFGAAAVLLVGLIGAAGVFFWFWQRTPSEALPDHLGLFAQSADRSRLDEIRKLDFPNALEGKDVLLKNDALQSVDANPTIVLYSDGKDVPIGDLRLIELDTIKEDGSFKQIEFQASPVEGKPEMKHLRIPEGVANGKYAFALLDGYLNEGKHKFWPFQVKTSSRNDNGNALRAVTVSMKPTPTPTPSVKTPAPTPSSVPPPSGGTIAYSTKANLVLRNGPSQDAYKLRNLRLGEKVYVLRYSENTEVFNGIESRFAYIQTESGQTGWVFAAFLR